MKIITDLKYLRQKSEPIIAEELVNVKLNGSEVDNIIKDSEDSLDLDRGIGLASIQIGIPKQVAIIRMPKLKLNLINPILLEKFDRFRFKAEKCLSLPGLAIDTSRYLDIVIKNGDGRTLSFTGLEAICVQHELNHMAGKLIIDKGIKWRKRR